MQLIQHNGFQELKPRYKYIADINETSVFEGLCATEINIKEYKDISADKAEEILKKIEENEEDPNFEVEDDGK